MYLTRLIIKRFGKTLNSDLKFKKGLNIIDCGNKREVAAAFCLAVCGGKFGDETEQLFTSETEIVAYFSDGGEKVVIKRTSNSYSVTAHGAESERYKSLFLENSRRSLIRYLKAHREHGRH